MDILQNASFLNKDCEITVRETLFSSNFIKIELLHISHQCFAHSNDKDQKIKIRRELIHRPTASGALLYNHQQQRFLLIEQFRVGAINDEYSPWQLEIIAGILDGDETPEQCIRRECFEEAGCQVGELTHLFSFYPSAGACSELFHLYAGQCDLSQVQSKAHGIAEEGEDILVHLFDYADIPVLLQSGRLRNAPVIMAVQWLYQQITISSKHSSIQG